MTVLQRWLEIYFSGTYMYFLDKENSRKLEFHWYFAVSTILLIVVVNLMFLLVLTISLGLGDAIMVSKLTASAVVFGVFACAWVYFVRSQRYRTIVSRWVKDRRRITQIAKRINAILFAGFILLGIRLVLVI